MTFGHLSFDVKMSVLGQFADATSALHAHVHVYVRLEAGGEQKKMVFCHFRNRKREIHASVGDFFTATQRAWQSCKIIIVPRLLF